MAKRYRSAVSGQFVKKDYAVKHPKTTVSALVLFFVYFVLTEKNF